eukprot:gene13680-18141_t
MPYPCHEEPSRHDHLLAAPVVPAQFDISAGSLPGIRCAMHVDG